MGTFTRDGVIYQDNGDGTATVMGYDEQPIGGQNPQVANDAERLTLERERVQIARAAAERAAATGQASNSNVATDNTRADATETRRMAAMNANLYLRGLQIGPDGVTPVPIPGWAPPLTGAQIATRRGQESRLNQLAEQINRTQELFNEGPGATTSGVERLLDFLPSDANAAFDVSGASLSQQGLAAFRVPGSGTVSDRDAIMFDKANLPTAATRDSAIREQLRGMRSRVDEERATLGLAPIQWEGMPTEDEGDVLPNAMTQDRLVGGMGPPPTFDANGGITQDAAPPEVQQAHAELIARLMAENGGRLDPQAYAQAWGAYTAQRGNAMPRDPEADAAWAYSINQYLDQGGSSVPADVQDERNLSDSTQELNRYLSTGPGVAGVNLINAGGFGVGGLLAGNDRLSGLNETHSNWALGGEIGGTLMGTALIGRLGRETVGKLAPSLFGGGTGAQFARNLAADVTYAGAYGAGTERDPGLMMLAGGIGSGLGQGATKLVGGAFSGIARSPAAQYLASHNIPLTAGQTIGGWARRAEEGAMSLPLVGGMIRNRRTEGVEAFDREAFRQGGEPIGFNPSEIGQEGLNQLDDAVSGAYTNVTAGTRMPLDPQFNADLQAVGGLSRMLPDDHRANFGQVMNNRVQPIALAGEITGDTYQQSLRGLKASRASAGGAAPGFEQEYKDAISGAMDTLTAQMQRGGGQDVVDGLNAANAANRNFRTLENAANRAQGGSVTNVPYEFSANMLQNAGQRTAQRYPGPQPFKDLADAGAEVLPQRLANSGTADRMGQMVLGGAGLTALGGGGGYAAGGDVQSAAGGAAIPSVAVLLAMLGGTKAGQKLITGALTARPDQMRRIGAATARRSGMFGSVGVPLALPTL